MTGLLIFGTWVVAAGLAAFIAGTPGSGGANQAGAGCGLFAVLLAACGATALILTRP